MGCGCEKDKPKHGGKSFTKAVVEIVNPEKITLLRKVVIPASLGDETTIPPAVGDYRNVILTYEASKRVYLYSSDGIPTFISTDLDAIETELERLGVALEEEINDRETAINQINSTIDNHTTQISDITTELTNEATSRQEADTSLQNQIDAISASSDVKDIVGTHQELERYDTTTLGDNDIIKVLQDETQDGATTYYRWDTETHTFSLIGEEGPYYTKAQADTLLSGKQDTLTAGENISIVNNVISSTAGTYSAGTGLELNGTEFSIDDTVALKTEIPTVNNGALTIQKNGSDVASFTANSGTNVTANITVPTDTAQLSNGAGFQTASDVSALVSGKQDVLTPGNNIQISGNTISATDTTYSAGNGLNLTGTVFSADTDILQTKLTPGSNITIENGVISSSGGEYTAGNGLELTNNVFAIDDSVVALKSDIPVISSASLTIQRNGVDVATFTTDSATPVTANITVPTNNAQLANGAGYQTASDVQSLIIGKQDVLTAGNNIQITGNTISATDTKYSAGEGLNLTGTVFSADTETLATKDDLADKQDILTAGTGIDITNDVISVTSSGPTVVQTTGTSTTDVMSQNATTSMIFADPSTTTKVKIGALANSSNYGIAIGNNATAEGIEGDIAIGHYAAASAFPGQYYNVAIGEQSGVIGNNLSGSIAFGAFSGQNINANGIIDVGSYQTAYGYDNSNYRLLTGVHDPVNAHDAATKGYVDLAIPTKTSDLINDGSDGTAEYLETDETAYKTASIPYGACDSTSTAVAYTATVPGVTELRDGVCMWLKNGVKNSTSAFTIDINGLGAKPVYMSNAILTHESTAWNTGATMLFVYDSTRVSGGCWVMYHGVDNNTDIIGYQIRTNSQTLPMKSAVSRYRLLFTSADGEHYVPANNSTSTNATSSRPVCQDAIDPFGAIFYYGTTANVAANARPAAAQLWEQYTVPLGFSFNTTGAALALTAYEPVYVVAAPQSDGSAIIDSTTPYTQDLPATEDGKIYIFLGIAYNTANIELEVNHPVYYYKDGAIRLWTNPAVQSITVDDTLSTASTNPVQNAVITNALEEKADTVDLATVATTGSYNDLSDKPTIPTVPTNVSSFTNDAGYLTNTNYATDTTGGVVKVGAGLQITNGVLSTTGGGVADAVEWANVLNKPTDVSYWNNDAGYLTSVSWSDILSKPTFATVATSGSYNDLSNKPTIPSSTSDLTNDSGFITNTVDNLTNYPLSSSLATVATTGSYNDLSNKPTIPTVPTNVSAFTNDANYQNSSQVQSAIATAVGDITSFDYQVVQTLPATGVKGTIYLVPNSGTSPNIYDEYIYVNNSFEKIGTTEIDLSDYVTEETLDNALADYTATSELATVATSGSYNDLTNKPTIPAAQVSSDWNATSGVAQILNKPTKLSQFTNDSGFITSYTETDPIFSASPAAGITSSDITSWNNKSDFSGDYNDLTNKPTIPTVNNATLTIQKNGTTVNTFTANASSNVTADITVPTATSDLTNDSGFITGVAWGDVTGKPTFATVATTGSYDDLEDKPTIPAAQVNADWNATSGVAQILNKPTIPTVPTAGTTATAVSTTASGGSATTWSKSDHVHSISGSTITSALGYTPYDSTNPNGYTSNTGTITGVSANGTSIATSGVANIPAATTSSYGVTQLSSATNSTSTSLAATPSAVKAAYDLANGKQDQLTAGTGIDITNNVISATAVANTFASYQNGTLYITNSARNADTENF